MLPHDGNQRLKGLGSAGNGRGSPSPGVWGVWELSYLHHKGSDPHASVWQIIVGQRLVCGGPDGTLATL